MQTVAIGNSTISGHRRNLSKLVSEIKARPFDFLPERSVDCLHQFFSGYEVFGPQLWRDLAGFKTWLRTRLFYPEDSGASWDRFIKLNAKDSFDGYQLFLRLYSKYSLSHPTDSHTLVEDCSRSPAGFDFHSHLYSIGRRPGFYLGSSVSVHSLASYLAGYFKGKIESGYRLTSDEKQFLRFEKWLRRRHRFADPYPWWRIVEMWSASDSLEGFFDEYDTYLTKYWTEPKGLEDLFEVVKTSSRTIVERRPKSMLPKTLVQMPETKRPWRGYNPGLGT